MGYSFQCNTARNSMHCIFTVYIYIMPVMKTVVILTVAVIKRLVIHTSAFYTNGAV